MRPLTLAWVGQQLEAGEHIVKAESLHGGITADVRMLTIATRGGNSRHLVLRSIIDPAFLGHAEDSLRREADALSELSGTGVPVPALVAVDSTAACCEHPSLLMTHLAGQTVLDGGGLQTRVPLMARQLVSIHRLRPEQRPREFEALSTPDGVLIPEGANAKAWAAAIDVIQSPAPQYQGRFLHRDFQPGNVLFEVSATASRRVSISGVVDWSGTCWGPADLDVAHCSTNLALLHGPVWGPRFSAAYEEAGGVLAANARERQYWLVRDALAISEEAELVAQPWRDAGRTELTRHAVEERLDAYVTALMDSPV